MARKAPAYSCPVCGRGNCEAATPITRKTAAGNIQVIAHRLRCGDCGYTDRRAMFTGAASLNGIRTRESYDHTPLEERLEE